MRPNSSPRSSAAEAVASTDVYADGRDDQRPLFELTHVGREKVMWELIETARLYIETRYEEAGKALEHSNTDIDNIETACTEFAKLYQEISTPGNGKLVLKEYQLKIIKMILRFTLFARDYYIKSQDVHRLIRMFQGISLKTQKYLDPLTRTTVTLAHLRTTRLQKSRLGESLKTSADRLISILVADKVRRDKAECLNPKHRDLLGKNRGLRRENKQLNAKIQTLRKRLQSSQQSPRYRDDTIQTHELRRETHELRRENRELWIRAQRAEETVGEHERTITELQARLQFMHETIDEPKGADIDSLHQMMAELQAQLLEGRALAQETTQKIERYENDLRWLDNMLLFGSSGARSCESQPAPGSTHDADNSSSTTEGISDSDTDSDRDTASAEQDGDDTGARCRFQFGSTGSGE